MQAQLGVYHIEQDEFIPGNLLYADSDALKTTDGKTSSTIVGDVLAQGYNEGVGVNARFIYICSFVQIMKDKVMVVDHGNNCTRLVDRHTRRTTPFVGQCTKYGYVDGPNAKFAHPLDAARYKNNPSMILLADLKNNAIRVINTDTKITHTLVRDDVIRDVRSILQHGYMNTFYISTKSGIFRYSIGDKKPTNLAGPSKSFFTDYSEGHFSHALFHKPSGMFLLNDTALLVADSDNHRVRVLDLARNVTSTVCNGDRRGNSVGYDGSEDECSFGRPTTFCLFNDKLLIGQNYRIRQIEGKVEGVTGIMSCIPYSIFFGITLVY